MKKRFELIDRKTGEIHEVGLGGKIFEGDEKLEIAFKKRELARGLVRIEYDEKGFVIWNHEEETHSIVKKKKMFYEVDCLKRELQIDVKEKEA